MIAITIPTIPPTLNKSYPTVILYPPILKSVLSYQGPAETV
jgi:hypothetical protein